MLDQDTRTAVLRLAKEGHSMRTIASIMGVSRGAVRTVIASGSPQVPQADRVSCLHAHLDHIRELHVKVGGNLVRVHEELSAQGITVAYSTLTDFCRQHGVGQQPKALVGRYEFGPADEAQHDTSPHAVVIDGRRQVLQCAAVVLCFSRMIFAQLYSVWNRFWCKVFLTDALLYFGGSARRMVIDNSSVILARGSGKNAVMAPEMEAFSQRFGFSFMAHKVGDANRSGRVERPFRYIETNFYPGRELCGLTEANVELRAWCERVNEHYKRHLQARPVDLFAVERPALIPLPPYVPEVYLLHHRTVDAEGYVQLHTNRYSVPEELREREVQLRETRDKIRVFHGPRLVAEHGRREQRAHAMSTLPEHRRRPRQCTPRADTITPEEKTLRAAGTELAAMIDALKERHQGRATRYIKRLYVLYLDYRSPKT